jgi:hypothetical protein
LSLTRIILAVLVAISLALTPLGAALAASQTAHMTGMADCDQAGKGACPCCDTPSQCPSDLCLAKCFKLVGEIMEPEITCPAPAQLRSAERPLRPPDSRQAPDPPPPRT